MQQGLRVCKHDEAMWVEYARMEGLYVQKLRMRREVLGLDTPGAASKAAGSSAAADAGSQDSQADDDAAAAVAPGASAPGEGLEPEAAVRAVLTGGVVRVALRGAMAAMPRNLGLRRALLDLLDTFDFPGTQVRRGAAPRHLSPHPINRPRHPNPPTPPSRTPPRPPTPPTLAP
jgi:U3 small nucleolar RNA-associated protein 6